jgi:peptide/nickel transport system permease protein
VSKQVALTIYRSYTGRRLAAAVLVTIGVAIAAFILLHVVPGDPARAVLGEHATESAVDALRRQWGLSQSLPAQFGHFIADLVRGRLGSSYFYHEPVLTLIGQRIGETAWLVLGASILAVAISLPLAALAASRQDRLSDHLIRGAGVIGLGMPAFWVGIVLIEVFAIHIKLLPVGGWGNTLWQHIEGLILPSLTAALAIIPILIRSLRAGMLEVLDSDFVASARARGLSETRVLFVHVMRNAIIPTIALLGLNIAFLVGSTVVVEQVFALNGVGALLLDSITNRDYPVVQGLTLVMATAVVLINLVTDLVSARLDPRIRLR